MTPATRLAHTDVVLEIMDKVRVLLEALSKSTDPGTPGGFKRWMALYRELVAAKVAVSRAASLTGVSRATGTVA